MYQYKLSLNQLRGFAELVGIGCFLRHDSYHIFLAIASCLAVYALAMTVCNSKKWRLVFYLPISLAVCQLSITFKKGVMDMGFRKLALENPTGVLFADIVYGFKAAYMTIGGIFGGMYEAFGLDKYSTIESLNYRFITFIVMAIIIACYITKRPARQPIEDFDGGGMPVPATA